MAAAIEATADNDEQEPGLLNRRHWSFVERHGLLLVLISPVVANVIGSIFNILYNAEQTAPLLTPAQQDQFAACVQVFNGIIYPIAVLCFILPLWWLRPTHRALLRGETVDPARLLKSQRYVVNLPWWFLAVTSVGWLICIPVFPLALMAVPEPLRQEAVWHLIISFLTASLIAITQSFFAVEMVSQKALFPVFFRRENPANVPGGIPLKLTARILIWATATVVSPVVSLVMLLLVPDAADLNPAFGVAVGIVAIAFTLVTGWMLARLVSNPVKQLEQASVRVAEGDLNVRVNMRRADEFGPLIESFNLMVDGLREREQLQETFGRHVGREAAKQIMRQDEGLVGSEQVISVMFVDVRNFTDHSSRHSPEEVVAVLNIFFREAVDKVEMHSGMVNKFLGDGFMALFGIGAQGEDHAKQAVEAGRAMMCCLEETAEELERAGWPDLKIGIGINSGPAIVGSIGSPKRQEYTAIGDTVNVAARVEALTKQLDCPLLVTESTRQQLGEGYGLHEMPKQMVKGKGEPLRVYAVDCD